MIGIALFRPEWFYPAMMIAVGAHYLPFMFLYGMWQFGVLSGTLITSGLLIAMYLPKPVCFGAWLSSAVLFAFALLARQVVRSEQRRSQAPASV